MGLIRKKELVNSQWKGYLFGTLRKIKKHLDLILDAGKRRIIWMARWSCSWNWNLKRRICNFTDRIGRIVHEILRI